MNTGKTLFAQLMDFLPWTTFARIVERYGGDRYVKSLCCAEHFRVMAFAQLTYRESLRDIEACLSAQVSKLYHMGFREPIRRSTLSDANEARDWRIYADFAQGLIRQARKLYAVESLGVELSETLYALDSTTIDLCLSVFPWALFRSTKAAVKMHTLLDLQGNIPAFIDVTPAKIHEIHTLDVLLPEPGSNKRWLSSLSARARTSAFAVLSLAPSTRAAAYVAIRPFVCGAFTRPSPTPTRCGAFVITMPKRRRTWSS